MARMVVESNLNSVARAWVGDTLDGEHMISGGGKLDAAQFFGDRAVKVVVGVAGALAAATSVPVAALSAAIPSGTLIDFGTNKFAKLSAPAAAGATSLTTVAIPTALVSGDMGYYLPIGAFKTVPSGTVLGRTYTERDANTPFGVAADADDEVLLLVYDVVDPTTNNDCELYRPGSIVKENLLATFAGLSSTLKAKIRAEYVCVRGAN